MSETYRFRPRGHAAAGGRSSIAASPGTPSATPNGLALWRRLLAEFAGTALLATAVVGSGVMATNLSRDAALQLLANSAATALGLAALILIFGPICGAHFNPVISIASWVLGRRTSTGLTQPALVGYVLTQTVGAIAGSILANLMFALPAVDFSRTPRTGAHLWLGEVVATAGLVLLVFALARSGRGSAMPAAVGAYIGAASWFTSSSFANPALTVGRAFTDSFAGIALPSVPGFAAAELIGLAIGTGLVVALYPAIGRTSARAAVARESAAYVIGAGRRSSDR